MLSGYSRAQHPAPAVPLYRCLPDESLDFVGTGTLIQYRGRYLLVSCAHCFDDNGQHNVIVGAREVFAIQPIVLTTQLPPEVDRCRDPLDFAVVELKPREVENLNSRHAFIPGFAIEGSFSKTWPSDYQVLGFLAQDNFADNANKKLTANAVNLTTRIENKYGDRRTQKYPDWYLPLKFEPQKYRKHIESGIHLESPEGLSGSPVIRCSHNLFYSLAGMVIEYKHCKNKRVLLALRSCVIRKLLDRWWPKIISNKVML